MPEDETLESKLVQIAVDTRKFEIGLFWTRSLFFAGFLSAAAYGFIQIKDDNRFLSFLLCLFGMSCSVLWILANRGSKFWQKNWEVKAEEKTKGFFSEVVAYEEIGIFTQATYSVSKLVMLLSYYIHFAWQLVTLWSFRAALLAEIPDAIKSEYLRLILINYAFIAFVLVWFGRSNDDSFYEETPPKARAISDRRRSVYKIVNSILLLIICVVIPVIVFLMVNSNLAENGL